MSEFTSFQALKSRYPTLSSLSVRVHGGLYGKDAPFDQTFTGDDSTPQSRIPTSFSCTNPRIKNSCSGIFDINSSIHHALQNSIESYVPEAGAYRAICDVVAPGMTQGCRNMCSIEIQATYQTP